MEEKKTLQSRRVKPFVPHENIKEKASTRKHINAF